MPGAGPTVRRSERRRRRTTAAFAREPGWRTPDGVGDGRRPGWLRDCGFDPEVLSWPYGAFSTAGLPAAGEISTPMTVGRLNGSTADADGDGIPDDASRAIDRAAEFGALVVLDYQDVGVGGTYRPCDRLAATVDHALDADVGASSVRIYSPDAESLVDSVRGVARAAIPFGEKSGKWDR